jgi:NADH-quinone oxidoreductase subunit F
VVTNDVWGLKLTDSGTYQVDPVTLVTSRESVFAGGDCTRGPAAVVQAIGDGQRAACAIDKMLGGTGKLPDNLKLSRNRYAEEGKDLVPRQRPDIAALEARAVSFAEVVATLGRSEAWREARRCLRCDLEKERK